MSTFIPKTGSYVYVVGVAPFDQVLSNVKYLLSSNTLISKLMLDTLNPFEEIYAPAGLTMEDMNKDNRDNVPILTFNNGSFDNILIPANRVKFINVDGVDYNEFGIGINLGALPSDTSLEDFGEELKELCRVRLGIVPTVSVAKLSSIIRVTQEQHSIFEIERDVEGRNIFNYIIQNSILKTTIESLHTQVTKLKTCIQNK